MSTESVVSPVRAPARLVVVAPNWLGDAVMALPLLSDVSLAWPDAHISVAARRSVAPLFSMAPPVNQVVTLDSRSGRYGWRLWRGDARRLAEGQYDAALLLPNSFGAAWVTSRAGIPERWGFARDLRGRLLTRAVKRPSSAMHQAEYYQVLAAGLGISPGPRLVTLNIPTESIVSAKSLLSEAGLSEGRAFVVMAPGAAYGRAKQWLPSRFAELSVMVAEERAATVLVGTKADVGVCRAICVSAGGGIIDLCDRTDLTTLAALMSMSAATIANDSGAMHLAAAAGAKVVAIFGPTDYQHTSPLFAGANVPAPTIISSDVWCRPCMLRECPLDHRCMTQISARSVFDALTLS
jgi:heptosyltransferase-2